MEIIGHRGARGLAKENTTESIKVAMEYKVDMIEVDVRMQGTKIVLSHDAALITEEYTTLQNALDTVKGQIPINLEIKETKVIKRLKPIIENYKGKILFSSKQYSILKQLSKSYPNIELAIIEKWSGVRAVAEASLLDTNRVHINHNWLWSGFVNSMKQQGYNLYAYTVNNLERAQELESWGVDGIFTDYPDRFR